MGGLQSAASAAPAERWGGGQDTAERLDEEVKTLRTDVIFMTLNIPIR